MLVTPDGIMTEPTQPAPAVTAPAVILKCGDEVDATHDVHRYVPSGGAAASAELKTITDVAPTSVAAKMANWFMRLLLPII